MSAARWRTWNGERFECYSVDWSAERASAYRRAGLKVRRFEGETFMRPIDWEAAAQIDCALQSPATGSEGER